MKILIWNYRKLTNTGGPEGYMFNLHEHLCKRPNNQIVFFSDFLKKQKVVSTVSNKGKGIIGRLVHDIKQIFNLCWRYYHLSVPEVPDGFDINEFDYVHIHKIIDFYTFKKEFKNYRGKIILTTHCPCPWSEEILDHFDGFVKLFKPIVLWWECKAYKMTDYLMFPCKGAREPYEKEEVIRKIFTQNEDKIFYVPSAITDLHVDPNEMQKISELGVPEGAFVLSYFGRHNSIKGYDILKKVGARLLDKYPELYILCAGRIDIEPYEHERWIELGFVNNVHELLYQTDLYISANRETYFDLVVLEILRSRTKLVLSRTGGNKYFEELPKVDKIGLQFFNINDLEGLISLVEDNINKKRNEGNLYLEECKANRELFLSRFTMNHFIENYINEIKSLC